MSADTGSHPFSINGPTSPLHKTLPRHCIKRSTRPPTALLGRVECLAWSNQATTGCGFTSMKQVSLVVIYLGLSESLIFNSSITTKSNDLLHVYFVFQIQYFRQYLVMHSLWPKIDGITLNWMSILNPGTRAFVNCREKESTVIRKHPETRVDIYIYIYMWYHKYTDIFWECHV